MQTEILETSSESSSSRTFKGKRFLFIYGLLDSATFDLKAKKPDGSFATTGAIIKGLGIYNLPVDDSLELRLDYIAGGSSSIGASVFDGKLK